MLVIVGIGVVSSLFSYQYSVITASRILDLASEDARSTAKIQAHDLAAVLANKVESVSTNLEILADAPTIQNQNVQGASPLFTAARKSTGDFASSYFWVDKDGKLLWADAFANKTIEQQYSGGDRSLRDYYLKPKESLSPYYTTVIESVDNVPRLYIGYPIVGKQDLVQDAGIGSSSNVSFKGVVVGAINLDTLGEYVQEQLITDYESAAGLLDRNGLILYSSNSPQFIGKNVFGAEVQSLIPEEAKAQFNQFLSDSLTSKTGNTDLTFEGETSTFAYTPVTIRGNDFAILYVITPHELAENAVSLIDQQRTLNVITVTAIGAVAAAIASIVLIWNNRLTKKVDAKTLELRLSNESLLESNKQLQSANNLLAEANDQLKIHDRLQREFVNVAAHELKTPIQPLLGAAELIESQFHEKTKIEVTKPEVEMIVRNAKRLERLSQDILELSHIESGALKLYKENFSLAYIIAEAVKDAKTQSNLDPDKLTITYHPDDIFVYADREKITQVITNLLTNAIKSTKEGTITITTQKDKVNGFAQVSISDTGTGIHPEVMPRLFEKFVTKSERGTGIGLYISKKIIDAHDGDISGKNNVAGPGATFVFTVPLAHDEEKHRPQSSSNKANPQDTMVQGSVSPIDKGVEQN
jgi:signal transduction histidine kinase